MSCVEKKVHEDGLQRRMRLDIDTKGCRDAPVVRTPDEIRSRGLVSTERAQKRPCQPGGRVVHRVAGECASSSPQRWGYMLPAVVRVCVCAGSSETASSTVVRLTQGVKRDRCERSKSAPRTTELQYRCEKPKGLKRSLLAEVRCKKRSSGVRIRMIA